MVRVVYLGMKSISMTKDVGKTEYKYVRELQWKTSNKPNYFHGKYYIGSPKKQVCSCNGKTARECALLLDKKLIELGYEPINILKRK